MTKPARAWTWYCVHLVVPALVVADALAAWGRGDFGRFERLALGTGVIWLVLGAVAGLARPVRLRLAPVFPQIVLAIWSGLACVVAFESLAHFIPDPWNRSVFLRPPHTRSVCTVPVGVDLPGIQNISVFSVNTLGLRGPEPPLRPAYRLITTGGSATECLFLDDSREWSHLVMEGLNQPGNTTPAWIANAGFSGHTTVHTLAVLKTLPVFEAADAWIIMGGINDFESTLAFEGKPTQKALEKAASQWLRGSSMRLARTRIGRALLRVIAADKTAVAGSWYGRDRAERAAGKTVSMPDLATGLSEYRERLQRLAEECRDRRKRCLFLTQPTMWRADLPASLQKLLWFGWVGRSASPRGFVSVADLARGMQQFNDVMLGTCSEAGTECIDLAAQIPKDTTALFDDCHFTEHGAQLVADAILAYLRGHPHQRHERP